MQLGIHQFVDIVGRLRRGGRILQILRQHQHLAPYGVRFEAGHHERLAPVGGRNQSIGIDGSRVVVVRQEHRQVRHVAIRAVGVFGPGDELLRRPFAFEYRLAREDLDGRYGRHFARVERGARIQPAHERLAIRAFRIEPFAAGVRHGADGLFDQQAFLRQCQIDAAVAVFASQAKVIAIGVKSE